MAILNRTRLTHWNKERLGVFNLNDPRWGRDSKSSEEGTGENREPNDSQNKKPEGPPDLEDIWRDFNRKIAGLFGGNKQPHLERNKSNKGGPNQPNDGDSSTVRFLSVLLLVALVLWVFSGVYHVRVGEVAVVTRLGQYRATAGAGMHAHLPWPIDRDQIIVTSQSQTIATHSTPISKKTATSEDLSLLTSDGNILDMDFSIQYKIENPQSWVYTVVDPERTVRDAALTAARHVMRSTSMVQALTEGGRDQMSLGMKDAVQKILDSYRLDVKVESISIRSDSIRLPGAAKNSLLDIQKIKQENKKIKESAQIYATEIVDKANNDAAPQIADANAYKRKLVSQAQSEATRFNSIFEQYKQAPEIIKNRMYIDTMKQIYGNATKVMVGSGQSVNLSNLPLEKLLRDKQTEIAKSGYLSPSSSPQNDVLSKAVVPTPSGSENPSVQASPVDNSTWIGGRSRERERDFR